MRHYFGYDINGVLCSYESYGPAGWPTDFCMENPNCDAKAVTALRERRAKKRPDIIDWVVFDCPCDPGSGHLLRDCSCVSMKFPESYVDTATKTLKIKPLRSVVVDGEPVENRGVITRPPGTQVTVKVVAAGIPDGETVKCTQKGTIDIALEDEWTLTFQNGETETTTLIAPAQGTKGTLAIEGKLLRPLMFLLRGFEIPT